MGVWRRFATDAERFSGGGAAGALASKEEADSAARSAVSMSLPEGGGAAEM